MTHSNYVFLVQPAQLVVPWFPRCAGTAIRQALEARYAHVRTAPVEWPLPLAWRAVALWREPRERFASIWRFLAHTEKGRAYAERHLVDREISLAGLVELALAPEAKREWHLRSQSYLELDLECERIPWDFERLAAALDTGPIARENAAPSRRAPWTPALETEVARIYAGDFAIWRALAVL